MSNGARVVVLGGYGVFGSRLVELLLRDGCEVHVAGRHRGAAVRLTDKLGGTPLALDRDGDLTPLLVVSPHVVVDATGPFTGNRPEPFRLAAFCIGNRMDYLDLSDDAACTAGIVTLDAVARAAGRFAISGASSVPGLSSTVVAALAVGMDAVDSIDIAILPGNRAPRGRALVESILSQAGRPIAFWSGGAWRPTRAWSDPRRYRIAPGFARTGYLLAVPDVALFPEFFGASSVVFRAGLELSLLNRGVALFSFLRGKGWLPCRPARLVGPAHWVAGLLEPFGSDRGAMRVVVTGRAGDASVRRRWDLIAEAGEGPFVPAVVARALIGRRAAVMPGARPCLNAVSLGEAEAAMSDLAIRFQRDDDRSP